MFEASRNGINNAFALLFFVEALGDELLEQRLVAFVLFFARNLRRPRVSSSKRTAMGLVRGRGRQHAFRDRPRLVQKLFRYPVSVPELSL